MGFAFVGDGAPALDRSEAQRESLRAHHHDPVVPHVPLVAAQLPRDLHHARDVAAAGEGGDGGQQQRIFVDGGRGMETLGKRFGDEAGVEVAGDEARMLHQRRLERDVRRDAADDERVERLAHPRDRHVARRAVADQLRDHRVVVHRHFAALVHARVDANLPGNLGRRHELDDPAGGRQEVAERILGVDPAFDRPAVAAHVLLRQGQPLAGRDADHQLDQIEAGDRLGDRVLDLQAGVHLEEIERLVPVDDELDRAGRLVLHGASELHRLLAHGDPRRLVEEWRRRLLDDLLVATLDRAFALVEVHDVAMGIAQNLDLDVPRILDELLDEHPVVAKRTLRLVSARGEAFAALDVVVRDAQALSPAAGGGLDHHRIADALGDRDGLLGRGNRAVVAGDRPHLGRQCELLRGDLVAHCLHRVGLRADEDDAFLLQRSAEGRVLRQESVSRVDGLGAGVLARLDDALDHEIALRGRGRTDRHGLIGHLDVARILVGIRVDSHRPDAHGPRGPDHAAGDFTAIGDEDFLEHVSVL